MAPKWMPEGQPPPKENEEESAIDKFAKVAELVTGVPLDATKLLSELAAKTAAAEEASKKFNGVIEVQAGDITVSAMAQPPQPASMQDNATKLIALDQQIEDAEKLLAALEAKRKMVEEALTEQFVEAGVQNVKMMGRTVFLNRSVYCSIPAETMSELVEVLDKEGVGEALAPRTVTAARINGLLKEDEAKWSEKLKGLISTGEKFSIRNRSAS